MDALKRIFLYIVVICGNLRVINALTATERTEITDRHNALRLQEGDATDMEKLLYDGYLEAMAQTYSAQCSFTHGQPASFNINLVPTPKGTSLGQNLYMTGGTMTLTRAVDAWYAEKQWYNFATKTCTPPAGKSCGHYTQVVWAKTIYLGCGYTACPNLGGTLVVCNYSPAGNLAGAAPYTKGPPATACGYGKYWMDATGKFCKSTCAAPGPDCVCNAQNVCQNCATVSPSCTCTCTPGWQGTTCAAPCADKNNIPCATYKSFNYCAPGQQYYNYMKLNCVATCAIGCTPATSSTTCNPSTTAAPTTAQTTTQSTMAIPTTPVVTAAGNTGTMVPFTGSTVATTPTATPPALALPPWLIAVLAGVGFLTLAAVLGVCYYGCCRRAPVATATRPFIRPPPPISTTQFTPPNATPTVLKTEPIIYQPNYAAPETITSSEPYYVGELEAPQQQFPNYATASVTNNYSSPLYYVSDFIRNNGAAVFSKFKP